MELRNEPKIGLELGLRKVALIATVLTVLIFTGTFIYTNLSRSPDSSASVQSATNTITGKVFCDVNQNKSQDNFENDLEGVKVWLFEDANGNGKIDNGEQATDSTTTGSGGSYSFTKDYTASSGSVTVTVSDDNDDAEEKSNGDVKRNGNYVSMNNHLVAFHFKDVAIPQGTTISSGSITVNSYNSQSSSGSVDIYADDVDNSAAISSSDDDISDRSLTSAKTTWSYSSWGYDVDYTSSDIAAVLQEIVNRSGWQSGNDITIIIEENSGSQRKVTCRDYDSDKAPSLTVSFGSGSSGSSSNNYIVRVDTSAYSGASLTGNNDLAVSFNSNGNVSSSNDFGFKNACGNNGKNIVRGRLFNDEDKDGDKDPGESEISGVRVRLFRDANGNSKCDAGDVCVDSALTNGSGKYQFVMDYDSSGQGKEIEQKVSNDNYDAEEDTDDGDMAFTSKDLDLNDKIIGLRFTSLSIPQGATITNAYIRFRADENSTSSSASVIITGEDVDDASGFTYNDDDLSDRTKTSNSVNWSMSQWSKNYYYNSADISYIIEEIVGRSNWTSGNDINLFFTPNGGSDRDAISRDESTNHCPKLVLTYSTGSSNSNAYVVQIDMATSDGVDEVISNDLPTAEFDNSGMQTTEMETAVFDASALPVDLIYFYAEKQVKSAVLKWATPMAENNIHFEIQRSVDGKTFTRIDDEPGNGNAQNIIKYQYVDFDLPIQPEPVYYRLKQIDFDGQFEYSPIVYISDEEQSLANVYPNPASDFLNISKQSYRFDAVILNRSGLEVARKEGNMDRAQFEVSTLPTGFYIVQIVSRTGEESYKVLVRH